MRWSWKRKLHVKDNGAKRWSGLDLLRFVVSLHWFGTPNPQSSTWTNIDPSYFKPLFSLLLLSSCIQNESELKHQPKCILMENGGLRSLYFFLFLTCSLRKPGELYVTKMRSLRKREGSDLGTGCSDLGGTEVPPCWWREVPSAAVYGPGAQHAGAETEDFRSFHGGKAATSRMLRMSGFSCGCILWLYPCTARCAPILSQVERGKGDKKYTVLVFWLSRS